MNEDAINELLRYLIELTGEVSKGNFDNSGEIFELTKEKHYPPVVVDLAESFSMMMVKIEAREYRLELMIEELRQKNIELEKTLEKVRLLENIKSHLGKFVPESVKKIIETSPEAPDLEKQSRDVSVLFLDIAGYTRMSENVEPEKMNLLIEKYFSSFLEPIHQNKGDINETAGDGLMMIFQDEDRIIHAENAVKTALAIREKVEIINRGLNKKDEPVAVNIGINSGEASVGSTRFEGITGTRWTYTATGPVTNIAARIGSVATGGNILIGEETASRVEGRFTFQSTGKHDLKNVKKPIELFRVLAG
jgi:class 3 adenylate cyclase